MIIPDLIIGFIFLVGIILYNALIAKKNQVTNAFSAIDVMLKKRFDLIPNLVEIVKQYMQHERDLLTNLTTIRSQNYNSNISSEQKIALDDDISKGIKTIMVTAENYPELKANTNFLNLQTTWTESEEQIAAARRAYNASVTDYNTSIMMFPGKILASMFNFQQASVLQIPEEERENIKASDLFN